MLTSRPSRLVHGRLRRVENGHAAPGGAAAAGDRGPRCADVLNAGNGAPFSPTRRCLVTSGVLGASDSSTADPSRVPKAKQHSSNPDQSDGLTSILAQSFLERLPPSRRRLSQPARSVHSALAGLAGLRDRWPWCP